MLLAGGYVLILKLTVTLHDLADIVKAGKKLGKAGGVEQKGKDVVAPVLLHGAHAGAVTGKLLLFPGLCRLNLFLLFGDHLRVHLYLFFYKSDLLRGVFVALVKGRFLFQNAGLLLPELVDLFLARLTLGKNLLLPALHLVDIRLGDRVGGGGDHADDQHHQHQHSHQNRNNRYDFLVVHKVSLKKVSFMYLGYFGTCF